MPDPTFDVDDLPDDPPPRVRSRTLWRLAVCVIRDHRPAAGVHRCELCGGRWPCEHRARAERVINDALAPPRPPGPRRSRNQAYLDHLRRTLGPPDPA